MGIASSITRHVTPKLAQAAPNLTHGFVREALKRAIDGVGPLPGAAVAAERKLSQEKGNVDRAIHEIIEVHVRYAGTQGFVTNLGGLVTAAAMIPANITGLTLIQCRMIAMIASVRGYDLADDRVRNAILACALGEDVVKDLLKSKKLPAPPMALATAAVNDPELTKRIAGEVATLLITKVTGKRLATGLARRIPVVGGVVGFSADAFGTWKVGRYAGRELLPRARR